MSLGAALAALSSPTAVPPIPNMSDSGGSPTAMETVEKFPGAAETGPPGSGALMSFTVHQNSEGVMFPQHGSHSSHSSHASHVSSSPGYGVPDLPNPVYAPPIYDPPAYAPPVVAPPVVAPTVVVPPGSSAPVSDSDIAYVACTRASHGIGVNDIANELERLYGVPQEVGVDIARQALASVLAGEHYCDGYLDDDHEVR